MLAAVAVGDRQAFSVLMKRHTRAMTILSQRLVGNPHDADEVVQESFVKAWMLAPNWNPERNAKFSTWLYRVVVNASYDRLRRVTHLPLEAAGDPADPAPGGVERIAATEVQQTIVAAMAELPERQRLAMALTYFGENSGTKVADALGVSISALESLLVRGKKALRKGLARRGITRVGDIT